MFDLAQGVHFKMTVSGLNRDQGCRADMPIHESRALVGRMELEAQLSLPSEASGLVIFAHGSGSSRFSPRNRLVAHALQARGFATLLLDLLTADEAADRDHVFDVALLGGRVADAVTWARGERLIRNLPFGLFGASTGAAAALVAATTPGLDVSAIVSRGGRPDLAGESLSMVRCPTLLIVGSLDHGVIALNQAALGKLGCIKRLELVPGATHLFEEPGTLDRVVTLAGDWFETYLSPLHRGATS
jgi:dienelactone hydrolase